MVATLDGYQFRLPSFEGPLDVLLRLIERDQLAISEISLLAVFDQFLAHLDALEADAPDAIAEFVLVAGRLSVLKSRALLPRPAKPLEEPDEIDLVAAAGSVSGGEGRGRAARRPAAHWLRRVRSRRSDRVPAGGASPIRPSAAIGTGRSRQPLADARARETRVASCLPRRFAARDDLEDHSALDRDARISFDRIRATCAGPQDTAVAFLALLTLMRRQTVMATQTELFGPIELARGAYSLRASNEMRMSRPDGTNGDDRRRT